MLKKILVDAMSQGHNDKLNPFSSSKLHRRDKVSITCYKHQHIHLLL